MSASTSPVASAGIATPADQHSIRDHNLAVVLRQVAREGASSRARIATETGLNKTTVSSLVAELIDRRLLRDGDLQHSGSVGRPARTVELDGDVFVAIGMEVNVGYVAWAIVDLQNRVREHHVTVVDNHARDARDTLVHVATQVVDALPSMRDRGFVPIAANLAVPGLVDVDQANVLVAPNLGWENVPAKQILTDLFEPDGLEVLVDNEANLAALAERLVGVGATIDSFIHVSGEVGVGAGLIVDGRLHRGALGFGGELGHMTLDPSGPRCTCGATGCVETYVGLHATLRRAGMDPDDVTARARTTDVSPAAQLAAAAEQEHVAAALDETGRLLGTALAMAVNLLSPEAIVLGGYFTPLHPWLAPAVSDELDRRVLSSRVRTIDVLPSELQLAAAVRGAAALTLTGVLDTATAGTLTPDSDTADTATADTATAGPATSTAAT